MALKLLALLALALPLVPAAHAQALPPEVPLAVCDPLVLGIYTQWPFVAYALRQECLPAPLPAVVDEAARNVYLPWQPAP
ncbi:MAG: hypothetical protein ABR586_02550 [Thermoplasmatota archaeon]